MIYKCPGQDKRKIKAQTLSCPECDYVIELFSDEVKARCPQCGKETAREILPTCIDWCRYAKECVGENVYQERLKNKSLVLKDKLLKDLEEYFGEDQRRINHARKVMGFCEELLRKEGGDWHIVIPAGILHDIGIRVAEKKYGSSAGHLQEKEGPEIAAAILRKENFKKEDIDQICQIIAHHHSPGKAETINFKVLYDADRLVNLKEEIGLDDQEKLKKAMERVFLTEAGKQKAKELYFERERGMSMFCYQCEQTAGGSGCTKLGVCGKNEDIQSLQDILLFGLKGIAAYAYHARQLGAKSEEVDAFMHEALFKTVTNVSFDLQQHLEMVLKCGAMNLKTMEMLDKAHTQRFGNPLPTQVETGTKLGPGILVTGHDLLDLYELLKQSEGSGVNIYTHSEMLPAHGYPELRKFRHLVGNYGGAWQEQKKEFNGFCGAILVTTNCVLIPPENSYLNRLFTVGVTGIPGATHLTDRNFKTLIDKAKSLPPLPEAPGKKIITGFHHTAILGLADKIVNLVKTGKIRRFFLIGGCDGAKPGRNYYTEFAQKVPKDCLILTLACGKYRFNQLDFGEIEGIPRLLDIGQCNNAYSAIQVAMALSKVFNCGVNELPLSLVLSWFEQKAVAILLTLLYLNIKGIYIGPTPPAFISKNVFALLQEKFDLKLISSPSEDLKRTLNK